MLDRLKKIVLSVSVVVLFALYAFQQKTRTPFGPSTVDSAYVATATPRDAAALVTVAPQATGTAATAPQQVSRPAQTPPPTATRSVPTAKPTTSSPLQTETPAPTATATTSSPTKTPTPAPTATTRPKGAYADGTYTGSVADANWGNVQVQVIVASGKVTDVKFLQYPNHRSRSRSINDQAMPLLIQEAIQSQNASVDVVSGATDTSEAFIQSLASALQQAKA